MSNPSTRKWLRILSWGTGFGITVVGCAYLGVKAGTLIDAYYNTSPLGIISGAFFGLLIPFYSGLRYISGLYIKK